MEFNQFNFANSEWLWGLLVIPVVIALYQLLYRHNNTTRNLEKFADKHLLPYLLKNNNIGGKSKFMALVIWSLLWACFMIALAGPRWDFTEIDTFTSDRSLVILLDLSQSMDATDVKPSRLARARQEIEDIINISHNVKIGIIAYAADAHMISSITDDMATIRNLLPSLNTGIVYIQGSRLSPAINMASSMLNAEPGSNKSILIISDGGFEDGSSIGESGKLSKQNITINAMGIGTSEGAPVPSSEGNLIKQNGKMVISRLQADRLQAVSNAGAGIYLNADYTDLDSKTLLRQIERKSDAAEKSKHKTRYWEERFYILIFPAMLLVLFWFRRGYVFPAIIIAMLFSPQNSQAFEFKDVFKNNQQLGKEAVDNQDYNKAMQEFNDPYRRGVAQYKAGKFVDAEKSFRNSARSKVKDAAAYNLGNSLAKQQKFEDAIVEYEKVIRQDPYNKKAKHNLKIVKKMLEQQKKKESKQDKSDKEDSSSDDEKSDKSDDEKSDEKSEQQKDNKSGEENSQKQDSDEQQDSQENKGSKEASKQNDKKTDKAAEEQAQKEESAKQDDKQNQQSAKKRAKTQKDIDADQWLNRVTNDPQSFLKNQFYIESKRKSTKEVSEPW